MRLTHCADSRVVVDEQNTPLAILEYEQVLRQGLLHRQVILVIFDHLGRMILHKRPPSAALYPGRWDCIGSTDIPLDTGAEDMAWSLMPAVLDQDTMHMRHLVSLPASPETGNAFVELFRARISASSAHKLLHDLSFLATDQDELQALATSFPDQLTPTLFLTWTVLHNLKRR